ncbi:hypothetical protein TEQG_03226 [Trichophyton equinum CBS 127.97]|uniref:Uncharacterized protein n=1 Tax=Trichophyton equinum (strain ATCC MYA-4606 / CBS 127.97) TaxID=559882 RepID=F2PQM7_TRIEC|nr:hypothetical protein TEQG_03226 [Trichophyton equinum CBS 127.97]
MLESRGLTWLQGLRRSFLPVWKQPSAFTSDEVTLTKQDTTSTANAALWQEDYDIEKSAQDISQYTAEDPQYSPAPPSLVDAPDVAKVVQYDRPRPGLYEATFSFEGLGEGKKYSIKEI